MILFNSVVVSVAVVLVLCLCKMNVVISLISGALIGGMVDGLSLGESIRVFSSGLGGGARIALSYAVLGAFASAVAYSGFPDFLSKKIIQFLRIKPHSKRSELCARIVFFLIIGLMAVACKNVIPVHIAFIPVIIPPLLGVFNELQIDRRIFSCVIVCGVIVSYMLIPIGFGEIFLDSILRNYLLLNGLDISLGEVTHAMKFPAIGMICGAIVSIFVYRKKRVYKKIRKNYEESEESDFSLKKVFISILAILAALIVQLATKEIILGALAGFFVFSFCGTMCKNESDRVVVDGFKMMAGISFTMLAAAGFGNLLRQSHDITGLVSWFVQHIGDSKALAVLGMLAMGFLISVGIGSSFSTVPIVAVVYVPLCLKLGINPMAIAVIVAVSGICGDAGSPASDSTLGPTMGLNFDGQHDHIYDTTLPAFLYVALPAFLCGAVYALVM